LSFPGTTSACGGDTESDRGRRRSDRFIHDCLEKAMTWSDSPPGPPVPLNGVSTLCIALLFSSPVAWLSQANWPPVRKNHNSTGTSEPSGFRASGFFFVVSERTNSRKQTRFSPSTGCAFPGPCTAFTGAQWPTDVERPLARSLEMSVTAPPRTPGHDRTQ
jgi:hypothetical protein